MLTREFTDEHNTVNLKTAIILPVTGSLMLLALFFFLDQIWILLVILISFSATMSFAFVIWPWIEPLAHLMRLPASVRHAALPLASSCDCC